MSGLLLSRSVFSYSVTYLLTDLDLDSPKILELDLVSLIKRQKFNLCIISVGYECLGHFFFSLLVSFFKEIRTQPEC